MKKRILALALMCITAIALVGCSCSKSTNETGNNHQQSAKESSTEVYIGDSGWSVSYDGSLMNLVVDQKNKIINLVYKGEADGTCDIQIEEVTGPSIDDIITKDQASYVDTTAIKDITYGELSGKMFQAPNKETIEAGECKTTVAVLQAKDSYVKVTETYSPSKDAVTSDKSLKALEAIMNSFTAPK